MADDWDGTARVLGYRTEKDLLMDFYVEENMPISEIAQRLGAGTCTISRRLAIHKIPKRARGGPNNQSSQSKKLFHMDQRLLHMLEPKVIATITGASLAVCYKFKKRKLGGFDGVLHNLPSEGVEAIFDTKPKAFGAAAGKE
jgi:hypothetical protein